MRVARLARCGMGGWWCLGVPRPTARTASPPRRPRQRADVPARMFARGTTALVLERNFGEKLESPPALPVSYGVPTLLLPPTPPPFTQGTHPPPHPPLPKFNNQSSSWKKEKSCGAWCVHTQQHARSCRPPCTHTANCILYTKETAEVGLVTLRSPECVRRRALLAPRV